MFSKQFCSNFYKLFSTVAFLLVARKGKGDGGEMERSTVDGYRVHFELNVSRASMDASRLGDGHFLVLLDLNVVRLEW
jgi:hypothetical protein